MSKIVVVGSNHAGTAAINTMLSLNKDNEVVVFDRNSNISFLGCGMALWIGGQIKGSDGLFYATKESLEEAGATVHTQTEVTDIDFDRKVVYAKSIDGKEYEENYDKLLLATGSIPFVPDIPGTDLENVQQVKLYQNANEVIGKLRDKNIKKVIVIGAGYIGVELVEAFQRHGKEVTLINRSTSTLSNYYDKPFTDLMDKTLKENGIKLELGQQLIELKGDKKVEKVVTDKGEYDADMVLLCIGFRPNTFIGRDKIKTFRNGAYKVDSKQMTSIKDVYAIGDCATVFDNSIKETSYIALASNALRSGIIAGNNLSGKEMESVGVQGSNGISIYGLHLVSTGITLNRAKKIGLEVEYSDYNDLQRAEFMENENPEVKIRVVYEKESRRIVGAQMASKYDMHMGIHMFSLAIQKNLTIDELKLLDIFFLP